MPRLAAPLAALLLLASLQSAAASRPAPAAADGVQETADLLQAAAATLSRPSSEQYSRRQLQLHQPQPQQGAAAAQQQQPVELSAVEASEAAVVGLTWGFHLEQLVQQLAGRGVALVPQQQQDAAVAALAAHVEGLAARVIAATRADMAALASQLRASVPEGTSAAAMATLLQSSAFHGKLKGALDDGLQLVSAALEPHLEGVAQTVHAALGQLVVEPGALDSLSAFSDAFLPTFSTTFSLTIVEATLLRTLWHDDA